MFFDLSPTNTVNSSLFDPIGLSPCVFSKKRSLNLHPCLVDELQSKQLDHFSLFALELFVRAVQNSNYNFPMLKIYVKIAYFLKLF
jgi:hypothetical protein